MGRSENGKTGQIQKEQNGIAGIQAGLTDSDNQIYEYNDSCNIKNVSGIFLSYGEMIDQIEDDKGRTASGDQGIRLIFSPVIVKPQVGNEQKQRGIEKNICHCPVVSCVLKKKRPDVKLHRGKAFQDESEYLRDECAHQESETRSRESAVKKDI